jgi:hypothetical protein
LTATTELFPNFSEYFRISGFHPILSSRIWPGDRGRYAVNGRFALKTRISCNAGINNYLSTGSDPKEAFIVSD